MGEKSGEKLSESVRLVGLQKRREKYSKETDSVKELRKYRVDSLLSNWGVLVRRAAGTNLSSVAKRIEVGNLERIEGFLLVAADIDEMKAVNTTGGHEVGDMVVVNSGRALSEFFRPMGDWVARVGGDEFLALVSLEDKEKGINSIVGDGRLEEIEERAREGVKAR